MFKSKINVYLPEGEDYGVMYPEGYCQYQLLKNDISENSDGVETIALVGERYGERVKID